MTAHMVIEELWDTNKCKFHESRFLTYGVRAYLSPVDVHPLREPLWIEDELRTGALFTVLFWPSM